MEVFYGEQWRDELREQQEIELLTERETGGAGVARGPTAVTAPGRPASDAASPSNAVQEGLEGGALPGLVQEQGQ